jgi:hypothetical protein
MSEPTRIAGPLGRRLSAVWFGGAMGLLDDAIRDHLELKRRRGADPSEVAREEREALDTVLEQPPIEDLQDDAVAQAPAETPADSGAAAAQASVADGEGAAPDATDVAGPIGETAELDMATVLGDEAEAVPSGATTDADSLEWEMPHGDASGQSATSLDGDASNAAPTDRDATPDVLEETPEFLRDTPEQERMWFEQQPPRDFDFGK